LSGASAVPSNEHPIFLYNFKTNLLKRGKRANARRYHVVIAFETGLPDPR